MDADISQPYSPQASTFLAFRNMVSDGENGQHEPEAEVGVTYDIALEIDQRNHWFEPDEVDPEMMALLMKVAARGLKELILFCFHDTPLDKKGMQIAMRKFVSVAWMLHSEELVGKDGVPLTLQKLGKIPQLKCSRCSLCLHAKRFGEKWNFHARVQKRQGSKKTYAKAAKRGWKLRRNRAARGIAHPHRVRK